MKTIQYSDRRAAMVDIETLALGAGGIIFEIGCVEFNPVTFQTGREFHILIDPASCREAGLKSDASTIGFWEKRGIFEEAIRGTDLRFALLQLSYFLSFELQATEFWCRGTDFDFPMLKAAFAAVDVDLPWRYYQTRDVRTVWADAFPADRPAPAEHDALVDCYDQITQLEAAAAERQRQCVMGLDLADIVRIIQGAGVEAVYSLKGREVASHA